MDVVSGKQCVTELKVSLNEKQVFAETLSIVYFYLALK